MLYLYSSYILVLYLLIYCRSKIWSATFLLNIETAPSLYMFSLHTFKWISTCSRMRSCSFNRFLYGIYFRAVHDDMDGSSGNIEREIEKRDDNYSTITALHGYAVKLFLRACKCVSQEMRICRRRIKRGSLARITRAPNKRIPWSPGYARCIKVHSCIPVLVKINVAWNVNLANAIVDWSKNSCGFQK